MTQEPLLAQRLRFWLRTAGATAAFGVVGLVLSTLGAPPTVSWAAAAGAAVAGAWGAGQLMQRSSERR